ncbi:MAG: radical SAM protein [Desulfobacteraceae bacterium]|jgi:MoaA/NifB/PqqE/SkfB family radical SAM enzyme
MNNQVIALMRIMLNPKITSTALRVLRELRKKGKPRLPEVVLNDLEHKTPGKESVSLIRKWLHSELISRHNKQWVLNSFLPPFPGTSFNRMFENLLSGRRLSPVSAYLAVTASCPNNCWHCSHKNRKSGDVSQGDWMTIIKDLVDLGTSIIGFTGGEPFSRKDLGALVQCAAAQQATTIVFSSGAFVTRQKLERLKDAGLWGICISLDHPEQDQYDAMRGNTGAFNTALSAIEQSIAAGFYTMIGMTATVELIEKKHYITLYDLARRLGVHEVRIIEPMPCGALEQSSADTFLSPEQIAELRRFHIATNKKRRLPKVCAFNQIESPEVFGCGAGTQHLFIDSAGQVCPCDFTPLSFGNATSESLAAIWKKMNAAMGNPRRHCFIQKHHNLISEYKGHGFPIAPQISEKICREAGKEPLPDFFQLVTGKVNL